MPYKATIIKPVCYWHKIRQTNRWEGRVLSKNSAREKRRGSRWGMDYAINAVCELGYLENSPVRSSSLSRVQKIKTRWVKQLEVKNETIKFWKKVLKKKIGCLDEEGFFHDLGQNFQGKRHIEFPKCLHICVFETYPLQEKARSQTERYLLTSIAAKGQCLSMDNGNHWHVTE